MTAPSRPWSDMDVSLPVVEAQVAAVRTLDAALVRTKSPSDRLAFALDEWLVCHPEAPVSTDATYPQWAAALAAAPTYYRRQEA